MGDDLSLLVVVVDGRCMCIPNTVPIVSSHVSRQIVLAARTRISRLCHADAFNACTGQFGLRWLVWLALAG